MSSSMDGAATGDKKTKRRFTLFRGRRKRKNDPTDVSVLSEPPITTRASLSHAPPGEKVLETSFRTHAFHDPPTGSSSNTSSNTATATATGQGYFARRSNNINDHQSTRVSFQQIANTTTYTTTSTNIFQDMERKRQEQKEAQAAKALLLKKRPWLCRTKFFRDLINSSFELVDQDGSGSVDEKELYSGLLLIHLKLGVYAGPAACKPIDREKCHAVFMKMDADQSGSLDKEEFEAVMMVLFGNVMTRVAIQYACTLLIVPMIAQAVLDGLVWLTGRAYQEITTLDEHYDLANTVELSLEGIWANASKLWDERVPEPVQDGLVKVGTQVQEWINLVPESVWSTIPLTLLSTVLSLMLIPWSLLKIDAFFQSLADRGSTDKNVKTTKKTN